MMRNVKEYLDELERSKDDRPEQVKEGLESYIDLWKKAIENGVVSPDDDVESALEKVEEKGGLYAAAEGSA